MTIIKNLHDIHEPIGLAFSGGLDTVTALLWMKKEGAIIHTYTADIGQPENKHNFKNNIITQSKYFGAQKSYIIDCKKELIYEGLAAIQCGAFHNNTAGMTYFNTTPLSRAVISIMLTSSMKKNKINIWSDGSTFKGNDIERFYRYGLITNNKLKIYKPWLDIKFIKTLGGRNEMLQYIINSGLKYSEYTKKIYSIDSNILGTTHEAKSVENLSFNIKNINPIMGIKFWDSKVNIKNEKVCLTFKSGRPIAINHKYFNKDIISLMKTANNIAGRHGLGMSDQIENRIIQSKSRGIYEAPGMALFHIAYERLITGIHNEDTINFYRLYSRQLGNLLYNGRWFDPQALLLRHSIQQYIASEINGEITLELRRGNDYSILNTVSKNLTYHPKILTMEKNFSYFSYADRIGQLSMQNIDIQNTRNKLINYINIISSSYTHNKNIILPFFIKNKNINI